MNDPIIRQNKALKRLRLQLKKKRESLADQFIFKMYIVFHFKDQKKPCAVFEITDVIPVMTNNYEESILNGAKNDSYSLESSKELLGKDIVQLHAPRWQSLRRDVIGCTTEIDFFLWPRQDIDRIECLLFSKWKNELSEFRPLRAKFQFQRPDYEEQLMQLLSCREKSSLIINNSNESMFLFVDRRQFENSKNNAVIVFKLASICLYIPQDELTLWGAGTCNEIIDSYIN